MRVHNSSERVENSSETKLKDLDAIFEITNSRIELAFSDLSLVFPISVWLFRIGVAPERSGGQRRKTAEAGDRGRAKKTVARMLREKKAAF